jgi:hypothetical protein
MSSSSKVTITEEGRSGDVRYSEEGNSITGWWEFGGGDAIAIVNMGSAADWSARYAWTAGRRAAILRRVADEVIRQKAGGCTADIDVEGGWITIRR